MKTTKQMTNSEFVDRMMNFSPYGALCQPVILQAIEVGLAEMLKHKDEQLAEYDKNTAKGKNYILNYHAWYGCCEDVQRQMKERWE